MSEAKGCLGCAALFFGLPIFFGIFTIAKMETKNFFREWREEKAAEEERLEKERVESERIQCEAEAKAAARRRIAAKEDKLRTFAMKNADGLWRTYQMLKGEIDGLDKRIEGLRKAFEEFDKNPDEDADYHRICGLRDEMVRSCQVMRAKIEDAYLAFMKFEATPGKSEYSKIMSKALEEGVREAEAAESRYKRMSVEK